MLHVHALAVQSDWLRRNRGDAYLSTWKLTGPCSILGFPQHGEFSHVHSRSDDQDYQNLDLDYLNLPKALTAARAPEIETRLGYPDIIRSGIYFQYVMHRSLMRYIPTPHASPHYQTHGLGQGPSKQ